MSSPEIAAHLGTLLQQGLALHRQGRLAEAKAAYEAILRDSPEHFDALNLLGALALQTRSLESAVALIGKAVALNPNAASAHHNLGLALKDLGRPEEALASFEKALALKPDAAEVHNIRGALLIGLKRFDEALVSFDRAAALNPSFVEAHNNRGSALLELKRFAEALASYDRALALKGDYAEAHYNRGNALRELKRWDDALASYDGALALRPDYAEVYINRGRVLIELKQLDDAKVSYSKAIALNPGSAEAHYNLGNVLLEQSEPDEALASYERAIALQPDFPDAYCNLIFTLNFLTAETTASQQARRKVWNDAIASRVAPMSHAGAVRKPGKLRIGYVSAYFRHQAATYAFAPAILHHDRDQFEVFCYSDTAAEDDVTALLKAAVTVWRPTGALSDEQLAAQIRADGIDILVDCVGHMKANRLLTFARKPAPIQITGWGEPTGTGLATMDYLLADPALVPQAERSLLPEAVIDLPCALGYWAPDDLPAPGALPAMAAGHVTFGSFNRAAKLTAATLELWARVLAAVPSSQLLLKNPTWVDATERARFTQRLERHGIDAGRVTLIGETTRRAHFEAYTKVDICLDPLPHTGGMTTLDALWMGLPVISLRGTTPSGRLATAVLTALGLTDWIAEDAAEYVAKAAALATDLERLSSFRRDLRARMQRSEIGDPARYAKALEARYHEIWKARQS